MHEFNLIIFMKFIQYYFAVEIFNTKFENSLELQEYYNIYDIINFINFLYKYKTFDFKSISEDNININYKLLKPILITFLSIKEDDFQTDFGDDIYKIKASLELKPNPNPNKAISYLDILNKYELKYQMKLKIYP